MRPGRGGLALTAGALAATAGALAAAAALAAIGPWWSGASACPMPDAAIGGFARIDGGGFVMGRDPQHPEEGPPAHVFVSPFLIQVHEVTNAQFREFVDATGHVTDAERAGASALFDAESGDVRPMSWWRLAPGVNWRSPEGPGSGIEDRLRHPVVHVTQRDARAYAAWAGGRLPGEVEWEYAASLGLVDPTDPASGVRGPDGTARANVWTGIFPLFDTGADGHAGVAPVGCYEASRVGVHDMIGNVWEWTESRFGPATPRVAIKGGSYLCGANFCRRARVAARESMEPDLGTGHVGFRIVKDVDDRG